MEKHRDFLKRAVSAATVITMSVTNVLPFSVLAADNAEQSEKKSYAEIGIEVEDNVSCIKFTFPKGLYDADGNQVKFDKYIDLKNDAVKWSVTENIETGSVDESTADSETNDEITDETNEEVSDGKEEVIDEQNADTDENAADTDNTDNTESTDGGSESQAVSYTIEILDSTEWQTLYDNAEDIIGEYRYVKLYNYGVEEEKDDTAKESDEENQQTEEEESEIVKLYDSEGNEYKQPTLLGGFKLWEEDDGIKYKLCGTSIVGTTTKYTVTAENAEGCEQNGSFTVTENADFEDGSYTVYRNQPLTLSYKCEQYCIVESFTVYDSEGNFVKKINASDEYDNENEDTNTDGEDGTEAYLEVNDTQSEASYTLDKVTEDMRVVAQTKHVYADKILIDEGSVQSDTVGEENTQVYTHGAKVTFGYAVEPANADPKNLIGGYSYEEGSDEIVEGEYSDGNDCFTVTIPNDVSDGEKIYLRVKQTDGSCDASYPIEITYSGSEYTVTGDMGENGWYTSEVTIKENDGGKLSVKDKDENYTEYDEYVCDKSGESTVVFRVKDKNGALSEEKTESFKIDLKDPDIAYGLDSKLNADENNEYLDSANADRFYFAVSDDNDVDDAGISFTFNNESVNLSELEKDENTGVYSYTFTDDDKANKKNIFEVSYTDKSGREKRVSKTYIMDSDKPTVTFYAKENNDLVEKENTSEESCYQTDTENIFLKLDDDNLGENCTVEMTVDGKSVVYDQINNDCNKVDLIQNKTGDSTTVHCISVTITDPVGKTATSQFWYQYCENKVNATLKCNETVIDNTDGYRLVSENGEYSFVVDFELESGFGIVQSSEKVTVGDEYYYCDSNLGGIKFNLGEGVYDITVTADYNGNSTGSFSKTWENVTIDHTAPTVESVSVESKDNPYKGNVFSEIYNALFFKNKATVTVKLSDNVSGVAEAVVKLNDDGKTSEKNCEIKTDKDDNPYITFDIAADEKEEFYGFVSVALTDNNGNNSGDITLVKGYSTDDEDRENKIAVDKTAPKVGDWQTTTNNGCYKGNSKTLSFKISERFLDTENTKITCSRTNYSSSGKEIKTTVTVDDILKSQTGVFESVSKSTDGTLYTVNIKLTQDGEYNFTVNAADLAGNTVTKKLSAVWVDNAVPTVTIKPSVSKFNAGKLVSSSDITMTTTVTDITSGIDSVTCSFVDIKTGKTIKLQADSGVSANTAVRSKEYNVTIPSKDNLVGYYSVTVKDRSNNETTYYYVNGATSNAGTKAKATEIYASSETPTLEVSYDNNSFNKPGSLEYYKSGRNMTVKITSSAFDPSGVTLKITKVYPDGSADVVQNYKYSSAEFDSTSSAFTLKSGTQSITFKKNSKNYEYTATYSCNENAQFTVEASFENAVGTAADKSVKKTFVIDKTAPQITVSYDNNSSENGRYFKQQRTAEIVVKEDYFNASSSAGKESSYPSVTLSSSDNGGGSQQGLDTLSWESVNGEVNTYKATIHYYGDYNYTFGISYTDKAGNEAVISYANGTQAANDFTVDKQAPTGTVSIGGWSWSGFVSDINYKCFSNSAVTVTISAEDNLSGVSSIQYMVSQRQLSLDECASYNGWINGTSLVLEPDSQSVVYAKIIDLAGNVSYISSDGIIVDASAPIVEKNAPVVTISPQQPVNGIYNTSPNVDISVRDAVSGDDVYSGLKSISYRVITDGKQTTSATLYTFGTQDSTKKQDLINYWSGTVNIDSKQNNSNNVVVEVTAVDNSDNITINSVTLKIDTTEPTISVSYNNNTSDSKYTEYYKDSRVATIVVTERNFDASLVKLDITNEDGTAAAISSWKENYNSSDPDATTYTATVEFSSDGDYTFAVSCTDLAGNECKSADFGNSKNPSKFTIDRTAPKVTVEYSGDEVKSGYYTGERTCKITVTEHNFDAERFEILLSASLDGKTKKTPELSDWKSSGDKHVISVTFTEDSDYTVEVSGTDMAGNSIDTFDKQTFTIDNTAPNIVVDGISRNSANNGETIGFTLTATDINFDSAEVFVKYIASEDGEYKETKLLPDLTDDTDEGQVFTYENLENDGMYTLYCVAADKSGNQCTTADVNGTAVEFEDGKLINFSVNRNGSVFVFDDDTQALNGQFMKDPDKVVIFETNVDEIEEADTTLTIFRGTDKTVLTSSQYERELISGEGEWYQYKYTIPESVFAADGVYRTKIMSTDAANNVSDSDSRGLELEFAVDNTKPICTVSGIKNDEVYNSASKTVKLDVIDNIALDSVSVKVNDEDTELTTDSGRYVFTIQGDSGTVKNVSIIYTDKAGNSDTTKVSNIRVTTSKWVLFYTNTKLLIGTIAGILLLIILAAVLITRRLKKSL